MGRRFVDMRTIQRRMQFKDDRINRALRKGAAMADSALTAPAKELPSPDVIAKVLLGGDLAQLTAQQKISYYRSVCESLGLNPLTKPFEYIRLSGREVLYATRNCTDQLRHAHRISVTITAREVIEDTYVVTARAAFPDGRHDESIGAVPIAGLKGESRSNAMMKCETKSKRRVTLSLVGLSTLDESEIDSIPGAQVVTSPDIPALTKSLTPSPGPVVAGTAAAVPDPQPAVGAAAVPADLNTGIPDAWRAFMQPDPDRLSGRIVAISDETKTSKKGVPFTKWSITLDTGELVTTLDRDHANIAMIAQEDEALIELTTKNTRWGRDITTIARLPEAESDEAF
jgi:hypothetical protein